MWYLGGKARQSKEIIKAMRYLGPQDYVEPFCGAMWSAVAAIRAFPEARFTFNDINPFLMTMWQEGIDGWDPPEKVSEETYIWYNSRRPVDDPMTGYIGFAWSFGGKFFGGAARTGGQIKGSYKSTFDKIRILRTADVRLTCKDYREVSLYPKKSHVYMDPPYEGRTKQSPQNPNIDRAEYVRFCEELVRKNKSVVLATEFVEQPGWEILHDWGDTVVRHLNAKPKDGTRELLMRVRS